MPGLSADSTRVLTIVGARPQFTKAAAVSRAFGGGARVLETTWWSPRLAPDVQLFGTIYRVRV